MENVLNIDRLITEGESLAKEYGISDGSGFDYIEYEPYTEWSRKSLMYLQEYFPKHPQTDNFEHLVLSGNNDTSYYQRLISILKAFQAINPQGGNGIDYEGTMSLIFNRFHILARQLKRRHNSRATLDIKDEYDVQDLLNAILCIFFDDVRPEEWTPSYAGSCNRIDFLIKDEEIAIEVKMTREGLKDKEIGEQLLIDIAKYKAHPNCKTLYSFVYDPEGLIRNPRGLEKDLDKNTSKSFVVKTFIRPL